MFVTERKRGARGAAGSSARKGRILEGPSWHAPLPRAGHRRL